MDFIKELHEARLTRNESNVRVLTYTDCCERLYLSILILELLRQYPQSRSAAATYAKKTLVKSDYSQFRTFGTDLYNFVHFVIGDDDALGKLKDPGSARATRKTVTLPVMALNRYLRSVASNTVPTQIAQFLITIESSVNITNTGYKSVRRNITNYSRLTLKDRQNTVTRLLYAARAKLRSADIIDDLSSIAAIKDLETTRVSDTEPTISTPDISVTSKDLVLYRQLVGSENQMLAKKFIEFAKSGSAIPPQYVRAYLPIIKMVDDIVDGGSSYVQLLRSVHKRAKKHRRS